VAINLHKSLGSIVTDKQLWSRDFFEINKKSVILSMPQELLNRIHSSASVLSGDWADFRSEVTGMYLLSGQGNKEWDSQHLIREYNNNIDDRYKGWTGSSPVTTGLFIEPYNDGLSYQGTGAFRNYP
jgi:hypothetical protein